jgi:Family of unknown function (DUF6518)
MKRALLVAVGAGVLLGAGTRFVYELPSEWWWLARVGGPWLVVAFGTGLMARKARGGALAGCICLVTATLVYYGIMGLFQHAYETSPLGLAWLFVAVPAGLGFGALGAAVRSPALRLPAAAALSAAFAAEAVLIADRSAAGPGALLIASLLVPLAAGRGYRERALVFTWAAAAFVAASAAGRVVVALTGYS